MLYELLDLILSLVLYKSEVQKNKSYMEEYIRLNVKMRWVIRGVNYINDHMKRGEQSNIFILPHEEER